MTQVREITIPKGPLHQKLLNYGMSDSYGFHMPGHKRHIKHWGNPYLLDITEIEGFDDLHHPQKQGLLVQAQERAARLYQSEETHFLINGSTAGVLSAISSCTHLNGQLLLARNSHRSAYHAATLGRLRVQYLYPQPLRRLGINGGIFPEDVDKLLAKHRKIQAVFVTSPTYEGICLNVRAIAEICHRYEIPLIVDQAHGAHFPFSNYFPEDAVRAGADIVIQSIHKTLPALTQTALLHVQGKRVDREKLRTNLSIYQSSSPSYVLMASIDDCMELLERRSETLFAAYRERLEHFRDVCRDLKGLRLIGKEIIGQAGVFDFDNSRLVISIRNEMGIAYKLSQFLRTQAHLQMEMAVGACVTGISSVVDRTEDFCRLSDALHTFDELLEADNRGFIKGGNQKNNSSLDFPVAESGMSLWKALEKEKEWLKIDQCKNRVSAGYLYLYPPGIPLIVPGERLTTAICQKIKAALQKDQELHGLDEKGRLAVVRENRRQ